jgi:hypothetical protein
MRVRPGFCTAAVLSLFAIAPAARAADPVKQCTLLSQQSAVTLFGAPLDPGRDMFIGCSFFGPHADDTKGILVSLTTGASMGGMNMASMYTQLLQKKPGDVEEAVGGLGDQARIVTSDAGKTIALEILFHNNILSIAASNSPNPNIKGALKDTAKQIMAKF